MVALIVIAAAALLGSAAAGAQEATPAAEVLFAGFGLPEITVTVTETEAVISRTQIPAGRYLVTLNNMTDEPDMGVDFVRLVAGQSVDELLFELPYWYFHTYLPGGATARSPQSVIELQGGEYGLWGPQYFAVEPVATLLVTGDPDTPIAGAEPAGAAIFVRVGEGGVGVALTVEGTFTAGPQIVQIVNAADQVLFISALQYPEPITIELVEEMDRFSDYGGATPPPDMLEGAKFQRVASISTQSSGTMQWVAMDLTPGQVYLACYIPDPISNEHYTGWYEGAATIVPVTES